MSNVQLAKMLGWTSLAVGATEIAATRWLQDELGVEGHETLLRAFGAREIAAGVAILAQPGLNRSLAAGLWARVAGDALDLVMLGLAARESRRPSGLAAITAVVLGVTGLDLVVAAGVQRELAAAARLSVAARRRVTPTQALPNSAVTVEPQTQAST